MNPTNQTPNPFIVNINKPAEITSYDVIRKFKPVLKKYGKVGHFGTLDPFADGVLMLGVGGAQRLNEYIHQYLPKTYVARGVLGIDTDTGDPTGTVLQSDESEYFQSVISDFGKDFIEKTLKEKFEGEYFQSPHKFSAAKFEGRPLHEWAREGVEIKKEQVRREVYSLKVIEYSFPELWIEYTVSSGTYIRTLFKECAQALGTLGYLKGLSRTQVGGCKLENAMSVDSSEDDLLKLDMEAVLPFGNIILNEQRAKLYSNGVKLRVDQIENKVLGELKDLFWIKYQDRVLGLAAIINGEIISRVNFPL